MANEVANTIVAQMGNSISRMTVMIGAHSFTSTDNSLTFKFKSRAKNASNCVRVTLEPSDTYTVEFISLRGASMKTKGEFHDVYAENLKSLFETETGLYLSL